ncbi:hypothetical protein ACMFMF_010354 [Clarireedia jacksonii]
MRLSAILRAQAPLLGFVSADTKYSDYILAPSSRTLSPASILQTGGVVEDAANLINPTCQLSTIFHGGGSYVTLDFGINIAGTVSFQVDILNGTNEAIGFTFTESSMWISAETCDATQDEGLDLPLWLDLTGTGTYKADKAHQRGGFRYMTIVHNATGTVGISNLTVYWIASPELEDPAAYTGYFHSSSEKLNRVWYAGAYTNQLCSVDPTTGNSLGLPLAGWEYNYTISNGTSVLVDGGKRDRLVWPGDIAISGPSIFVSTNSLDPIRNGIDSLMRLQQADGRLPYAGAPFNEYIDNKSNTTVFLWSFTYHCHTLNDIYDYYLFTGDHDYLSSYWIQYKLGVNYLLQFIDSTGLANVTSSADWLRVGMGGHNIEANSILYFTLQNALALALIMNDTSNSTAWAASAAGIPPAANSLLWDDASKLYWDNDTQKVLHPQDGNAWAVLSGLLMEHAPWQLATLLQHVGFGHTAHRHLKEVLPSLLLFELIEMMWADFMLDDPRMTNSTFIEGYSNDGSLAYPAYQNDPRVSHAHGWATGPTSSLSFLGAGLQLSTAAGQTWKIAPALGGLESLKAGYETPLGNFSVSWHNTTCAFLGVFETPEGTSGDLEMLVTPHWTKFSLDGPGGTTDIDVTNQSIVSIKDLAGGKYVITIS